MKDAKEIRDKELKIRLSIEEFLALQKRKTKPKLAQWAREVLLLQEVQKPLQTVDPKLLYELNKIGVNLNQLAKRIHTENIANLDGNLQINLQKLIEKFDEVIKKCL